MTPPPGVPLHPDYEHYDNIGRSTEQIIAAHFGMATEDDLLRWARRDAEGYLAERSLPTGSPAPLDTAAYRAALNEARTIAEVSAVTRHLIEVCRPVLESMGQVLSDIADWNGRYGKSEADSPSRKVMEAANRLVSTLWDAEAADLAALRATYDPAPTRPGPKPAPGLPPAPPEAPSSGPKPSR